MESDRYKTRDDGAGDRPGNERIRRITSATDAACPAVGEFPQTGTARILPPARSAHSQLLSSGKRTFGGDRVKWYSA
ncbi:hypothetical protein BCD67_21560 [Oscillatoriales cyanobacterium USR001]|nr:hypothetical protein BCD67_21560 [Oscillatoriales cyanobacterium USR001]